MPLSDKDILGLNRGFPMPVADPTARRDLQTKAAVTEMQQRGATERSTATNLAAYDQALAPLGMTRETAGAGLPQLLKDLQFERILGASGKGKRAGLHPTIPEGGISIGALPGAKIVHGDMAGQAQARAAAEATRELEDREEKEQLYVGEVPLSGISKRKSIRGTKDKFKEKGTPRARDLAGTELDKGAAERMMAFAAQTYPGKNIKGPFQVGRQIFITVDDIPIPVTRNR